MFIKRKIIPVIHTNKFIHLSKLVRSPYTNPIMLKPYNYINPDFLNTMLYQDLDAYYLDTYPFYLEYLETISKIDIIKGFYFQKWDMYYYDCRISHGSAIIDDSGYLGVSRFVGLSPGLAHANQGNT